MKRLWNEYMEIVAVLRCNLGRFVKYQIGTKLLLAVILMPLFHWSVKMLMKSRGLDYIANGLVQKFLISPQGILLMVIGAAFALSVVLIELGGLIVLSHQAIFGEEESSFYNVAKCSIQKIKYLMGIDGLFIILYLFFIAPMIDSNLKTSMLQQLSIPGFIMDVIKSKTSYMIYMASLGALFAVISIRWMFALHIIMLGGNNKRHFLKASGHIVKSNFRLIVKRAVGVKLMNMLMMGAAATIYILVSLLILIAFAGRHEEIVMAAIFGAGITGVFAASFLLVPFEMIRMTKLYYSIQYEPAVSLDIDSMGKSSIIDKVLGRRWVLGSLILAGVAFASYFTYTISKEFENVKYDVKITAHRGSSKDAPENTLSAIDAAARNGADYAEIDVQQTRDGRLVLLHDKSFKRTTGVDKNVWEVTLDEVKGMDAGMLFGKEFEGEKVPTLEEVIDHSKGRIRLNIEIKTNGHESNIAKQVANTIAEKGIEKSCVVTSLDYSVLEEVEKLRPQIETGYIMFIALGELDRLEVDFYSVEESNIDSAFVARAHLVGRKVHAWTINTQESMENVLSAGVDNIITDNDRMLRNIIDEKNSGEGSI